MVFGGDAGAGVGDGDADLAVDLRGVDGDGSVCGGELDRVREQVEDDLAGPALVAADDVNVAICGERDSTPSFSARSRTITIPTLERVPQ